MLNSLVSNDRRLLPAALNASADSSEVEDGQSNRAQGPNGSEDVSPTWMPAVDPRPTTRRATHQEIKKARARLSELEDQLQFVGRLEATLHGLQRGSRAPSVESSEAGQGRVNVKAPCLRPTVPSQSEHSTSSPPVNIAEANQRSSTPPSDGSSGSSHQRAANENPSVSAAEGNSTAERVELDSARTGSPMVRRYHTEAAMDWVLPNSVEGRPIESTGTVQKGRNTTEGSENATAGTLDPLDEEEEMLRRVNSVITSIPAGGEKSFYQRPSSHGSSKPVDAKGGDRGIMLGMSLDQLRDIVREEVKARPLTSGAAAANPKAAWNSIEEEYNDGKPSRRSSTEEGAKPKRKLGASRIPRTLEEAIPTSCRSYCKQSPVRMKCFEIATSAKWATFFLVVTLANSIYIAVFPGLAASEEADAGISGGEAFDYFCVAVLMLEILASIIAFGFYGVAGTEWLVCSDFHKLDLFVFCATMGEYVALSLGFRGVTVRPFRLLRVFKAMIRIKAFSSVKAIIQTLKQGMSQLLIVFSILLFFVACAGIFGMAILQRSFERRCVTMDRQVSSCASDFSTGWRNTCDMRDLSRTYTEPGGELIRSAGYPGYSLCKIVYNETEGEMDGKYPLDAFGRYHTCQLALFKRNASAVTQYCEIIENPNFGFQHFDHIGGAILSIFQVAAPDGSYDIIHNAVQSEPTVEPVLWTFFFLISCLCTFLLLGLFVAVVTGTFKRVREGYGLVFNQVEPSTTDDKTGEDGEPTDAEADQHHVPAATLSDNLKSYQAHMPELLSSKEVDTETILQAKAHTILYGNKFKHFISAVILLHCIAMAFDRYGASQEEQSLAQAAHIVANIIFLGELSLRMLAFGGVSEFWKSRFNRVELLLVFSAFIGLATGAKLLVLLAAVRLYQLMKYFRTLYALLKSAVASTRAIANLVLFIVIVALCFAVAGRYVFQDLMNETTRSNFGSFPIAMLTVFQLLTGDSWSSVVYHAMNSKETLYGQVFAACFIMSWFVFSKLIVTNLFVAVIIENFEVSETIANIQSDGYLANMRKMMQQSYAAQYRLQVAERNAGTVAFQDSDKRSSLRVEKKKLRYGKAEDSEEDVLGPGRNQQIGKLVAATAGDRRVEREAEVAARTERVLYCFQEKDPSRAFFIWLGRQWWFDTIIYTAIMVGCVFLVITPPYEDTDFDDPIPTEDTEFNQPFISFSAMRAWNFIFTLIFTVEFITHVMADGLLFTKDAYLKSGWNIVDSLVLFFAWVDETGVLSGGSVAKVLRLARALRPLRLMKRNEGMRKVIDALIRTLGPVAYVILFSMFSFVVFSLIGMGIFGGKMFRCTSPGAEYPGGKLECSGLHVTEDTGIMLQRVWVPPAHNFDSFVEAGFTLFRVNTIKYVAIITDVMDITQTNQSPKENYSSYNSLFFVVYLIVGALFVMNLFVGFIVDGFNANRGSSDAELQYSRFLRAIKDNRPRHSTFKLPINDLSVSLRGFVESRYFQTFSLLCVLVNVVFMLADHAHMTPEFRLLMDTQNDIFLFELCGEMVLFLFAYGWSCFVTDAWKGFDLFVCLGTVAFQYIANNRQIAQFAKSFRLMRIIRLMKMIKPIRVILETLIQSVPQLLNVLLLLVLVYSMFAVVAVQSFGTTKYGQRLGKTANFETWTKAMTTIYQMVTGDEWMLLMEDCSVMPPSCTYRFRQEWEYGGVTYNESGAYDGVDLSFGDCGSPYARVFFMVFMLICESVMLNLFIGMILDNFSFITDQVAEVEDQDWDTGATSSQITKMADVFMRFDLGTGTISLTALHGFMMELDRPLGLTSAEGHVEYSLADRSAERLIRAELNVLVRERLDAVQEENRQWGERFKMALCGCWLARRAAVAKKARFRSRVTFEEVMITMLYWRKPSMVPDAIKAARRERVRNTLYMMHALAVKDFMRTPIAIKARQEVNQLLVHRKDFIKWSRGDPDYTRRFQYISATRRRDRARAARNPIYRNLRAVPSVLTERVELLRLDHEPRGMQPHHDRVRISQQVKFPKPVTGALGFLSEIKSHALVLRFVDVRYGKVGLVACDLSACAWLGWNLVEGQRDALYQPRIRKARVDEAAAVWGEVVLTMKELSVFGEELDLAEVGTLLDVQGFIRYSDVNESGQPKDPVSALRFNVGTFRVFTPPSNQPFGGLSLNDPLPTLGFKSSLASDLKGSQLKSQSNSKSSYLKSSLAASIANVGGRFSSMAMRRASAEMGSSADSMAESKDCVLEVVGYLDLNTFHKLKDPAYRARSGHDERPAAVSEGVEDFAADLRQLPAQDDPISGSRPKSSGFVDAQVLASTTAMDMGSDSDEDVQRTNPRS